MRLNSFLLVIFLLIYKSAGYDVLLVLGGMYIEGGVPYTLSHVEAIGVVSVCEVFPLPEPRHSLFVGRLSDRVIACGGNDGTYERWECFAWFRNSNRWIQMLPDLREPLIFAAAAGDGRENFYVVGGRRYSFDKNDWEFQATANVFNSRDNLWRSLPSLPSPIANACMTVLGSTLVFSGGSKKDYLYAHDPSKIWTLNVADSVGNWTDQVLPEMLGNRMWHGCMIANLDDGINFVIAGGYYNGRATMAIPISSLIHGGGSRDVLEWRWLGYLPEERQWGPAMGMVAGVPTLATGKNYGDTSIDSLDGGFYWRTSPSRNLTYKREFAASVSVPHNWLPGFCRF